MSCNNNNKYPLIFKDNVIIPNNLKKYAIQGAGATVLSRVLMYVVTLIGTIVLARIVSPDQFGLVAMVTIISDILIEFGLLRLSEATIQEKSIEHRQISTLFWINVIFCVVLAIILICLSPAIVWFYKEPRLKGITIAIAITFVFNGLSLQHLALMQRNMEFVKLSMIQISAIILSDIIAIAFAIYDFGYWALVIRKIIPTIIITIGAWATLKWIPGKPEKGTGIRHMLKFGLNSLGTYAISYLSRSVDKVIVGSQFGAKSLGFYERAYHLFVMPVNQLTYPLTGVAVATLSKLRNEPEKYKSYYFKALFILGFFGMPLSALLTIIGKDFVVILLGNKWEEAGIIFSFFAPFIGMMLIYGTHGWLHLSLGHADRWFKWGNIAVIVTIVSFILGSRYGPRGLAFSYGFSYLLLLVPSLWYAGKPINLNIYSAINILFKPFAASFISGAIIWYLFYYLDFSNILFSINNRIYKIIITSPIYIVTYLIIVTILYWDIKPIYNIVNIIIDVFPEKKK